MISPDRDDDYWCTAEFPGDDMHAGQLCERQADHLGQHFAVAEIAGTRHSRTLVWGEPL